MPLASGTRLGPYEILAQIGAGGMGTVYKARDTRLDRVVAIKVSNQEFSERFDREARAVAALNHPNIFQLYDVGPNYLVMEFLEGHALLSPEEPGPLPLDRILEYATQICDALDAAHQKGTTHRDLKPANILVTRPGVKLLDFGLAKVARAAADKAPADGATQTMALTGDKAILGTVHYMSPEQAESKPVDARSDIFSFGVVLYEMLSGRRAFEGESAVSILAAILHKEPAQLDSSPEIQRVVSRCLAKRPADRFQTILEVRSALRGALAAKPKEEQPSIAVMPFANLSADKENEYFSDGLAEDILNALVKVPGLRVTARTSSLAFRGKQEDVRSIAQALNVEHILEGSVRKMGNRLRVTAQLIKASTGYHLWSERYDREMIDVFAIQDEISQAIVNTLKLKLTGQPLLTRPTADLEAYNLYLQGRHLANKLTPESIQMARGYYERALARDPNYALAYAGLGFLPVIEAIWGRVAPRSVMPDAKRALQKALELDATLPQAHADLGIVMGSYDYDWAGAEREMKRALELGPDVAEVHFAYSYYFLRPLGRIDEAALEQKRAVDLDPLSPRVIASLAQVTYRQNRLEEAILHSKRALELDSTNFLAQWTMGLAYFGQGRIEAAIQAVEQAVALSEQSAWVLATLHNMYLRAGRIENATAVMAGIEKRAKEGYVAPGSFAIMHFGLKNVELALDWYEKAVEERDSVALALATEPGLGRLRSHPRYQMLRRKMGIEGQ